MKSLNKENGRIRKEYVLKSKIHLEDPPSLKLRRMVAPTGIEPVSKV
jgi:hypothetical protein